MKKVLFATTALIATASVAAADVRISGYGRFGLDYNDANDSNVNGISKTTITSRLRLQFDMSAESDSGVGFDARFRIQAESRDNVVGATRQANGARFGVTYEGFRLNVGNIIGAIENTPGTYLETRTAGTGIDGAGFVSHVGNVNNEYFNWDAYSSGGGGVNGVEALYSAGGFTGHISYSKRNNSTVNPGVGNGAPNAAARSAIMLAYNFGDFNVAASYQDSDFAWEKKAIITGSYDGGNWGVRLAYADNDGIGKVGLYGNYDIGAASNILVWVTNEDAVSAADVANGRGDNRDGVAGSNNGEGTSYGIHYSYDLGGGASFETGYRRASNDNDTFQAGVYFSF
ncbi:porin [Tropicibacter sp. R16_0]|uniref:porin n=1 Tax=Tropicibacter sp. R16_0 TaxID=2821102 RepID=UPI001ADBF559|nr:porin [Tropicibacter sp. R16_0]MBO9450595.1 porin [Tropicibacter sp. R16_0]